MNIYIHTFLRGYVSDFDIRAIFISVLLFFWEPIKRAKNDDKSAMKKRKKNSFKNKKNNNKKKKFQKQKSKSKTEL